MSKALPDSGKHCSKKLVKRGSNVLLYSIGSNGFTIFQNPFKNNYMLSTANDKAAPMLSWISKSALLSFSVGVLFIRTSLLPL